MWAPAVRTPELALAAYGLALRITQDETQAVATLESVTRLAPEVDGAVFLRRVRRAARFRRTAAPDPATAPRPPALSDVSYAEWGVLERVALRGMTVGEAAAALRIERGEALRLLHRGMLAAGGCLSGDRQARGDAQAAGLDVLGGDLAAGGLHDPARDGQPQAAAVLERRR
jgi:hypothetical protein